MLLVPEEQFALEMLFRGDDVFSATVRVSIGVASRVGRRDTGVGFFTTIRFPCSLPQVSQYQWDWSFTHRKLNHGGAFICVMVEDNILELEGIVHSGVWPASFDRDEFYEAF